MRLLPWLVLAISLAFASAAEARHFWQTYGSTMPAADGCGCTWNWNSDYFVPRYPSSCRYGLFSPCKSSCTTSPACRWCHPFYPGYCSIYGPCHYRRKNHVYAAYCGCTPIPACLQRCRSNKDCCAAAGGCATKCVGVGCGAPMCSASASASVGCVCSDGMCCEEIAPLYHVESSKFETLGSIPVEGSELLTRTDLTRLGGEGGQLLLQPPSAIQQLQGLPLQNLNLPQLPQPNRPTP